MDLATGAIGTLLPKLGEILKEEYELQTGLKKQVRSVRKELQSMQAALIKLEKVPRDQVDTQKKLWAGEIRELSYAMEDIVDMVLVSGQVPECDTESNWLNGVLTQLQEVVKKVKYQHQIGRAIKEIKEQLEEVASRRDRNNVDVIMMRSISIDPRVGALHNEAASLVGIKGKKDVELLKLLADGNGDMLKIVSVAGSGGLGKTTLVRVVYDIVKDDFRYKTFVTVGQRPDLKKVLRDIWKGVASASSDVMDWEVWQIIDKLKQFLEEVSYLIVIDDIWDKELWKTISLAFSRRNNHGSRIITTSRNQDVAEACCSFSDDVIYAMLPLTEMESEILFSRGVFFEGRPCPPELKAICKEILKKCGGVPLAILAVSSLLASEQVQSVNKWRTLLQSIGHGLTDKYSLTAMRKILLLSYDDLPHPVRTFLLYMSMCPVDRIIWRNEVIWKMIAEGFIQCGEQGSSYELGITYFNELVCKNLIIPVSNKCGEVISCRIHDIMLDILRLLSKELNFSCVLDGTDDRMSADRIVRRLSLRCSQKDCTASEVISSMEVAQVRAVTFFPPTESVIDMTVLLPRFKILRVLDLRSCDLKSSTYKIDLKCVCSLLHLRYLSLAETGVSEIPENIGNLQFLQFLNVMGCPALEEFPFAVCYLTGLMFLAGDKTLLPYGFGYMLDLEVLKGATLSLETAQELGSLSKLTEVDITFQKEDLELEYAFVESLRELENIQQLVIVGSFEMLDLLGEQWEAPEHLRCFDSYNSRMFSKLPAWLKKDPRRFSVLSDLRLKVLELEQEDLTTIGSLPALLYLVAQSTEQRETMLTIGADGFQRLRMFDLSCGSGAQIGFGEGSLPRVNRIRIDIGLKAAKINGKLDCPLSLHGNMGSLQHGRVCIYPEGVTLEETEAALHAVTRAFESHPNNPSLSKLVWRLKGQMKEMTT